MSQYKCPRCGCPEEEPGLCYGCKCDDFRNGKCDAYGHYFPTEEQKELFALRKEIAELKEQLKINNL